jgi:hypothetical protein
MDARSWSFALALRSIDFHSTLITSRFDLSARPSSSTISRIELPLLAVYSRSRLLKVTPLQLPDLFILNL